MTADMCWGEGSYVFWPDTPGGNEIAPFSSSPESVVSTAQEMVDVALDMKMAASTLQTIAESDDGQQGKAVDKLRESVGETFDILGEAGEMYYRTAAAIRTYGNAIGSTGGIAEALGNAYTLAEDAWERYGSTDGDLYGDLAASEDDDDPNAAQDASDNKAKYDAFQDWMNAANHWDKQYEDWEDAWNAAIDAIEDAHEHGPKDGWNEWFGDFLEVAYLVLTIVAIIAGVVALVLTFVVTGPILAAVAAIATTVAAVAGVLIAVIAVTRAFRGEASWGGALVDIACAVPGVGPVLKLASKIGPGLSRLTVAAGGVASDLIGPTLRFTSDGGVYMSRALADGVDFAFMRGAAGLGMTFDIPPSVVNGALGFSDAIGRSPLAIFAMYPGARTVGLAIHGSSGDE